MKRYFRLIFKILFCVFALIGVFFSLVFVGMRFGLFNVRGSIAERNSFFLDNDSEVSILIEKAIPCLEVGKGTCSWNETPEWQVVHGGLLKDIAIIKRVGRETGVSERKIAMVVVPEQLRFFTSEREVFKRYFEPLKILGTLSQFSLGVSGIKEDTALLVEEYASSTTSPFYPGAGMDSLIKYDDGADPKKELFNRLTDEKDHYYSYLYTALLIKEIESQWRVAGFDISSRPEITATLFNIGFKNSKPNATPLSGGAVVETGGTQYAFGDLGGSFYYSSELEDVFPKK